MYENGRLQAFCVDSVDAESWYNKSVPPAQRAARQVDYDRYLVNELVPFVRVAKLVADRRSQDAASAAIIR